MHLQLEIFLKLQNIKNYNKVKIIQSDLYTFGKNIY